MWIYWILVLWLCHSMHTNKLPLSIEDTLKSDTNATITNIMEKETSGQFINNLTVSDVRNILEILLLTFKKQPSIPTLKLLELLLNNLIRQNSATKELHKSLVHELMHYQELRNLLGGINLDTSTETPSDIVTRFEPLFSTYNNFTLTAESELGSSSNLVTEPVTVNDDLLNNNLTTASVVTEKMQLLKEDDFATSTIFLKHLPVNFTLEDTSELVNLRNFPELIQEVEQKEQSQQETTLSYMEEMYQTNNFSKEAEKGINLYHDLNPNPNFDTASENKAVESDTKQILKIDGGRTDISMLPALDEFLLNSLNKFNIKLVRSYSETFEPVGYKHKDEENTHDFYSSDTDESNSRNLEGSYHKNRKISIRRNPRSLQSLQNSFNEIPSQSNQFYFRSEELSKLWKKVFGYDLVKSGKDPNFFKKSVEVPKPQNFSKRRHFHADYTGNNLMENQVANKSLQLQPTLPENPNKNFTLSTCKVFTKSSEIIKKNKRKRISHKIKDSETNQSRSFAFERNVSQDIERQFNSTILIEHALAGRSKNDSWAQQQFNLQEATTRRPLRPPGKTVELFATYKRPRFITKSKKRKAFVPQNRTFSIPTEKPLALEN